MPGPVVLANGTELVLTPLSGRATPALTPYSARGLTQTLDLIVPQGGLRRSVTFELVDFTNPLSHKYASTITCNDAETPMLDNVWVGQEVLVDSVAELSYPTGGTPNRTPVSGSEYTQNDTTYYRPQLYMRVAAIKMRRAEYGGTSSWSVDLQEI